MFDSLLPKQLADYLPVTKPRREARNRLEADLSYGRHLGPATDNALPAAVMILLYPSGEGWQLPLTLRPTDMTSHAGQISFPGGLVEPGETTSEAALRELEEELGVVSRDVQILGHLPDSYIFVTNFVVTPWIGVVDKEPTWKPNPAEVAEVLHLPLDALQDPANQQMGMKKNRGVAFRAPYFALREHQIWGATSIMLSEFAAVLEECEVR